MERILQANIKNVTSFPYVEHTVGAEQTVTERHTKVTEKGLDWILTLSSYFIL